MKQHAARAFTLTLFFKVLPVVLIFFGVAYIRFAPVMGLAALIYVIWRYTRLSRENYWEPQDEKAKRLRNSPPPTDPYF